jgi:hypothetical protein
VAAEGPKSVSGLGIASLVVGIVGLVISLIPCVGLIGLPIAGIGLLLGLVGLIIALAGKTEGAGLPISGIAVSLAGCIVSVVWWYITVHSAVSNVKEGIAEFGKRFEEQRQEMERKAREEEAKEAQARANPVAVSATELLQAYDTNGLAADSRFKGKWLEVRGEVADVARVVTPYVKLKDKGRTKPGSVGCAFEERQEPEIARLKTGDQVTIRGKCDGKSVGEDVRLEKCELVK